MVMTFAVCFSTVHVGLVVYASTDAVLGGGHLDKGAEKMCPPGSPPVRGECKADP